MNSRTLRASLLPTRPRPLTIDYAYYNPVSLLLKKKGWLEAELAKDGIGVRWVLSLGSNKALEFLRDGAIDFGSTAGSAAIVARAGGLPIKAIYVYSKPEWTALVTRKDSGIGRIEDLKDKSVAVTRGTDPHIFLLRALDAKGLSETNVNAVLLQHPDGYRALATRQVDAWAGLDPHMAKAQVETGAVFSIAIQSFNTYGILNVREAFAKRYPELVRRVLAVYERARTLRHRASGRAGSRTRGRRRRLAGGRAHSACRTHRPVDAGDRERASGDLHFDRRSSAQDRHHRCIGRCPRDAGQLGRRVLFAQRRLRPLASSGPLGGIDR